MVKASQWDRLTVIAIAGSLTIWAACLVVFWSLPFGAWGGSLVLGGAAAAAALGLSARLPGWLVRSFHGLQEKLHLAGGSMDELASGAVAGASREDVRGSLRLLALAAVLASIGGAISSAAVLLADPAVGSLSGRLHWTGWSWPGLHGAVQLVSMLPMAVGATLTFLAAALLRAGRGHDAYADLARDWIWGLAGGLGVFALARGMGMNLVGLAMAMGVVLLALAGALLVRQDFSGRTGRLIKPIETPTELRRLAMETTFAALAMGLMIQLRVLSDVGGVGLAGRGLWLAGSLGLLAWFLGKADAKGRLPGRRQGVGCQIGLVSGLTIQLALAALCGISKTHLLTLWYLPVVGQIPLAALAAQLICRERMLFVNAGGRPRGYLSAAGFGIAAGLLAYLLLTVESSVLVLLPLLGVLIVAAGFLQMVVSVRHRTDLTRWSVVGLAVVVPLGLWVGLARWDLHRRLGRIAPGRWMTRTGLDLAHAGRGIGQQPLWRSEGVSLQVRRLVGQGRWWIVAFDLSEVHQSLPYYIQPVAGAPDVGAVGPGPWQVRLGGGAHSDWIDGVSMGMGRFDGILLSSIPADHPEAWRVYNLRTLQRAAGQLLVDPASGRSRPLLIRTSIDGGQMGPVLSLAETFRAAVGSGWMAAQFYDDRADILLAGPVDASLPVPQPGDGVFVIRLSELVEAFGPRGPIRVFQSPGWLESGPGVAEVVAELKQRARAGD